MIPFPCLTSECREGEVWVFHPSITNDPALYLENMGTQFILVEMNMKIKSQEIPIPKSMDLEMVKNAVVPDFVFNS